MPMALINFLKPKNQLEQGGRAAATHQGDEMEAEELCPNCHRSVPVSKLWADDLVCSCGHHFRMRARKRIDLIVDEGSFSELYAGLRGGNPLDFPGYDGKVELARRASDEVEGVVCGTAQIGGSRCCLFVMESGFMMGSMGSAVGEKITRLFEYATQRRLPVVGFTVSGGARMQEGLLSLMQMAKTSAAVKAHSDAGLLYIAVLTDPTTGGVTASFAMEADIILAEPGATVGFAGARVIEQTTHRSLPKGFQTAEFVLEHGFIDKIVPRSDQRDLLAALLEMHPGR
ncbi:Acetyl-coenzyme A carboxylase carboxyl transferase subunit beta [Slackia heliotrinireducens]|nr:Acetyl-coenzyme A carboxylase carboxyl transferase subunit beta [Slackia heliotrinireducens]